MSRAAASAQAKRDDKKNESMMLDFEVDIRSDVKERKAGGGDERLTEIVQRHILFLYPGSHVVIPRRWIRVLKFFRGATQGVGISIDANNAYSESSQVDA